MNKVTTLLLFSISMLFCCCKKDSSINSNTCGTGISEGTLSAYINGDFFENGFAPSAQINQFGTVQLFSIGGAEEATINATKKLALILMHSPELDVKATSYQSGGFDCNSSSEVCGLLYYGFVAADEDLTHTSTIEEGSVSISFSCVDYKSGGRMVGTFSGVLLDDAGDVVNITDGKFNVVID